MNRPGAVPQSMRGGLPGFGGQPQHQPQGRSVSQRIPSTKIATNGAGWGFGGGVPVNGGGSSGLGSINPGSRQPTGNLSFAQSVSGSQPATPLDPSEFPSLSNNPQQHQGSQSTMWGNAGRNPLGAPMPPRNQGTPNPSHQQPPSRQQEDIFSEGSQQGSFRFGSQAAQSSQAQRSSVDDFPPLNRNNANGDIGQERGSNMMSSNFQFGSGGGASSSTAQPSGAGNGLLNALSANSRTADARTPTDAIPPRETRSSVGDEDARQKRGNLREDSVASQASLVGGQGSALASASASDSRNPHGAIGASGAASSSGPTLSSTAAGNAEEETPAQSNRPSVQDPMPGMSDSDRWGLKGMRHMMNVHPDFNALLTGVDPSRLGLDLASADPISEQIWNVWDDAPPRPAVPNFRIPECYRVNNVQPIEAKIPSFNEETLFWIFYSCPQDVKQIMAAIELNQRNWRWNKRTQYWLTKDDTMTPQILSRDHERGYYIVWDPVHWRKEKKEVTLYYSDLESSPQMPPI